MFVPSRRIGGIVENLITDVDAQCHKVRLDIEVFFRRGEKDWHMPSIYHHVFRGKSDHNSPTYMNCFISFCDVFESCFSTTEQERNMPTIKKTCNPVTPLPFINPYCFVHWDATNNWTPTKATTELPSGYLPRKRPDRHRWCYDPPCVSRVPRVGKANKKRGRLTPSQGDLDVYIYTKYLLTFNGCFMKYQTLEKLLHQNSCPKTQPSC